MPERTRLTFEGQLGDELAGLLEVPDNEPKAYVMIAHCFTCGKDIPAASRIARALVEADYAVLRFDFTGLGGSDGDFSNTNFSSNVGDLVAAANFLRDNYKAPELLVGHSLGGTAVLVAAQHIPETRGVVTIGSPADPEHVAAQFMCDISVIEETGEAEVELAGRTFTIKKQFLDDIRTSVDDSHLAALKVPLLLFHSPHDETVLIREAEKIYKAAKHPKSFVSLSGADHLLTRREDAAYVAKVIAAWATRYLPQ
ncbi:MAG: lysophospholipase [Agarilytica sp.]